MTEQGRLNGSDLGEAPVSPAGRRAYATAEAAPANEAGDLFAVFLDGRPLRAPSGALLLAPPAVAQAAAEEWAAQGPQIDPSTMPFTRALNTAVDRIAPEREAVIDEIAAYGGSDLICYRAERPEELVARETAAWDPLVDWAAEALAAPLTVVVGVAPERQPILTIAALRRAVSEECDIGLAALFELTTLSGSLVIALAVRRERLDVASAWAAARIDEEYQVEKWGRDAEADAAAANQAADFEAAARLARLLPPPAA